MGEVGYAGPAGEPCDVAGQAVVGGSELRHNVSSACPPCLRSPQQYWDCGCPDHVVEGPWRDPLSACRSGDDAAAGSGLGTGDHCLGTEGKLVVDSHAQALDHRLQVDGFAIFMD